MQESLDSPPPPILLCPPLANWQERKGVYRWASARSLCSQQQQGASLQLRLGVSAGYDASMLTLSLPRNYHNQQIADFARVEGLPGIYMANQLDASIFEGPSAKPFDKNYNEYLQTKVSHPNHPPPHHPTAVAAASCAAHWTRTD